MSKEQIVKDLNERGETEREMMERRGLLQNPNQCMLAEWVGMDTSPTTLEQLYEQTLHQLARELEHTRQQRDEAVREGYKLREELSNVAQGLEYLALYHSGRLTAAQREMVAVLLRADG